jgi:hypothetical protein
MQLPPLAAAILILFLAGLAPAPPARAQAAYESAIAAQLKIARESRALSRSRSDRFQAELADLGRDGALAPADLADARAYLAQLQAMVTENDQLVARLENLYRRHTGQPPPKNGTDGTALGAMVDPVIPEEQTTDKLSALDRELDATIADFDASLLATLETIRRRSSDRMQDLENEAAAAAERLKAKGIDLGVMGKGAATPAADSAEAGGERQTAGKRESGAAGSGTSEDTLAAGERRGDTGDGAKGPHQQSADRRRSSHDDDVVARQLREAAEKETDPVLKEKLWKEYDDYKKSQR